MRGQHEHVRVHLVDSDPLGTIPALVSDLIGQPGAVQTHFRRLWKKTLARHVKVSRKGRKGQRVMHWSYLSNGHQDVFSDKALLHASRLPQEQGIRPH